MFHPISLQINILFHDIPLRHHDRIGSFRIQEPELDGRQVSQTLLRLFRIVELDELDDSRNDILLGNPPVLDDSKPIVHFSNSWTTDF